MAVTAVCENKNRKLLLAPATGFEPANNDQPRPLTTSNNRSLDFVYVKDMNAPMLFLLFTSISSTMYRYLH